MGNQEGFFDSIDHDLLMRALRFHTSERWVLLYLRRWLEAPVELPDGSLQERTSGTPQGGVISPLLACPASTPLADWRQSSWPVRGTDRPPVVAGDNWGAMTLEATRKLSHTSVRAIASTDFL
nr:reverse transcriptase domain-containing protein [Synechococcus sp. CBW1108]